MSRTLFEALGYRLGRKAAQVKNAFDLMGGTEEESLQAEIRLGRELAAALLERTPLMAESESTRFAGQIGRWLAAYAKERNLPFSFRFTAEAEPNAFALPGGPVFMSWPLLMLCQEQRDEIAFVLGHEMGHIVRRHAVERVIKDAALSLLLRQSPARHAASAWLGRAGHQLLVSAYAREDELEADRFAADLVRRAGGEPAAGARLLEKLGQRVAGRDTSLVGTYFATHPPLAERVARLRAQAPA